MPLDPTISLQVAGGGGSNAPPLAGAGQNVLGAIAPMIQTFQGLNQLRQFQAQFQARQQAGQIIAQSPDVETAVKSMLAQPNSGFMLPVINDMRQMEQTLTSIQGARAGQARDAFGAAVKGLGAALDDPSKLPGVLMTQFSGLPQEIQRVARPMFESLIAGATQGLPSDPAAAKVEYNKRLIGWMTGSGVSPDAVLGSTGIQDINGAKVPFLQKPAFAGGGVTIAPQSGGPGPVPMTGGNALAPAASIGSSVSDSNPLVLPPDLSAAIGRSPSLAPGAGIGGANVLSPAQSDAEKALVGQFEGKGLDEYNAAQAGLQRINEVRADAHKLAQTGGLLVPGTAADLRTNIAKGLNTLWQATGHQPLFDASAVAAAEGWTKNSQLMSAQLANQFFGGSHVAAESVNRMAQAFPFPINSTLGSLYLLDSLSATAQRVSDLRRFQEAWRTANQGQLSGSIEAFNKARPPEYYADQVLEKYGMTEKGFADLATLKNAVNMGYLTPVEAAAISKKQGFTVPTAPASSGAP